MCNVVLTGFMGTGKTTVGREVARRLALPFVDMDAEIVTRTGKSISRIFAEDGEAAFREQERALCRELSERSGHVIATGGGTLVDPANRAMWPAGTILICLRADVDAILQRVGEGQDRPLLNATARRAEAERLLAMRHDAYAALPWQVDTTAMSLAEVAAEVVRLAQVRTLRVAHPDGAYDIHIGEGTLRYLGGAMRAAGIPEGTRIAIVTNRVVAPLYLDRVREALTRAGYTTVSCVTPDGEQHKTLDTVHSLYDAFLEGGLDRGDTVLALGGGVTGDVAGFAAATYLRGVRVVQLPTTLLAMTDASVGAKTGVDLPQGKNLVGAFKHPVLVFVDLDVLGTLPAAEHRSGLAEVIKHAIIGDRDLYERLRAEAPGAVLHVTPEILSRSVQVKIGVVEEDPLEQGRRAVLNLGHTVGHALERLSGYALRHGEAVAMGMVAAAGIAEVLGRAREGLVAEIAATLISAGLPTTCPPYPVDDIWSAMRHDKKRQGERLRWILPREIGEVEIARDVSEALVRATLIELGARG
jgi:shikimate kinase / 3-dehydroquinate synthase